MAAHLAHPVSNLGLITVSFKEFLQDVGICRLNPLVVLLFRLHDVKAELLVELDSALVVDLDVEEDGGVVAVLLDDVEHVLQHLGADVESAVGSQAAQGHDIKLGGIFQVWNMIRRMTQSPRRRLPHLPARALHVDPTAHGPHHDIVEVGQLGELPRL